MYGKWVVVFILDGVVGGGDGFGGPFPGTDAIDELQLLVGEGDVAVVEVVGDGAPPILILTLLNELFDFIPLFALLHFREFVIIPEMAKLIIPLVWHTTDFDFYLLVVGVVGDVREVVGLGVGGRRAGSF